MKIYNISINLEQSTHILFFKMLMDVILPYIHLQFSLTLAFVSKKLKKNVLTLILSTLKMG